MALHRLQLWNRHSARLAGKLDLKFDDGLPYRGKILGGKIWSNGNTSQFCNNTALVGGVNVDVTEGATATYLKTSSLGKGCLVVFIDNYNMD